MPRRLNIDLSENLFNFTQNNIQNRYFNTSHPSNRKIIQCKNNINIKEIIFNMSLDNLLYKFKKRRLQATPLLLKDREPPESMNTFVTRVNRTFSDMTYSKPATGYHRRRIPVPDSFMLPPPPPPPPPRTPPPPLPPPRKKNYN